MGWLSSHTELLPKLWGARRYPQDSTPGHLHCGTCPGLRVTRPTGGLGTFGSAPPWSRSPRQQDSSWQEQLRPAQQAQPRFREPAGFIHKLLRLPKLQVMRGTGTAGAEAAGPAPVLCTRSAWPRVGAGSELRVPGELRAPAPLRVSQGDPSGTRCAGTGAGTLRVGAAPGAAARPRCQRDLTQVPPDPWGSWGGSGGPRCSWHPAPASPPAGTRGPSLPPVPGRARGGGGSARGGAAAAGARGAELGAGAAGRGRLGLGSPSIPRDRGGLGRRQDGGWAPAPAPAAAAPTGPGAAGGPGQPARRALEQLQPAPAAGGLHGAGECQRLPGHLLPALQRLGARAPAGAVRAVHGERGGVPHLQHQPGLQALGVQPAPRAPQPHQVLGEVPALQRLLTGLRVPRGAGVLLHIHANTQPPPGLPEDEGVCLLRLHVALRGEAGAHPAPVHPAARGEDRGPGKLQPGDAQAGEEHQRHQPQAGTLAPGRGRRALPHDAVGLVAPGCRGGPASAALPSAAPPTCCPS